MTIPQISIIVALGKNTRAIGVGNTLLWRIPEDLKRFKELTTGHPIIMGRKTFESIGRALPNRHNIAITRNSNFVAPGATVCGSLEEALEIAQKDTPTEIFIIGGGQIYTEALPLATRLYLTLVESDLAGDVFFPDYSSFTKVIESIPHPEAAVPYTFLTLEK